MLIIIITILSFNTLYSQILTNDYNFLFPQSNLEIKYHDEWGAKNYKHTINNFKKNPLKFNQIVFLGNSITAEGGNWGEKLNSPNVRNRGIAGDVTDGILARIDEIIYFKSKAIFLLIGINDLWNFSPGIPSTKYISKNILKIVKEIKNGSTETQVYVQTILPTSKSIFVESINKINNTIKSKSSKFNFTVIDLHSYFVNNDGLIKRELTTDGIHLNSKGYQVWVEIVRPIISSLK
tara:strand:+ start:14695 stop:15402 length:708 start_codon:yes stop_codon:yes gene_type:complete